MKIFILSLLAALAMAHPHVKRDPSSGKIVGGTDAVDGQFPWQISLQPQGSIGYYHSCGGSIYDASTIITAAHCVSSGNTYRIIAGDLEHDASAGQVRDVSSVRRNVDYSAISKENDIAILKLSTPLVFGSNVAAVSLPSALESFTGDATVSGWGTTSSGGSTSATLKFVDVPILTDSECRGSGYEDSQIKDSMLCAGRLGRDSCQGDSGGPLVYKDTNTLIGIVSWGYSCAAYDYPGVYTEVSYFLDWIAANA